MFRNISFVLLFLVVFTAQAQEFWHQKIDKDILVVADDGHEIDFLVVMKDQLTISTEHLTSKEEKGAYVFNRLSTHAAESQKNIQQWLRSKAIPFDTYFIANFLHIEAHYAIIEMLAKRDDVASINGNPVVRQDFVEVTHGDNSSNRDFVIEWGITRINADDVWGLGYQGTGVVVGGQDTGYNWEHPALKDKYRGWDGTTANHNYNWHDAIHQIDAGNSGSNPCGLDSGVPCDDHGHGTHTMGTMVGDDGAGNQIGVAPAAKWIGCRNMERGDGTPTTYIECFQWFMAPTDLNDLNPDPSKAPHVINNSWGCPPSEGCNTDNFAIMETALNNLKSSGVMVVVSAGNAGSGCSTVKDPAAIFEESFSIGAMNSSDNIAGFSSRGAVTIDGSNRMKPNVSAPGVSVRSCTLGSSYSTYSGTSMAGPHVAGAVALMIDANAALAGDPNTIESILASTARPFYASAPFCGTDNSSSLPNNVFGYGAIDALAAVNASIALPLNWISFEGHPLKNVIQLNWRIAQQLNIKKYSIEKSTDGYSFFEIGEKVAKDATESVVLNYTFNDLAPTSGIQYFRIKVLEYDGHISYSKIITVDFKKSGPYIVSPNPCTKELTILMPSRQNNIQVDLYTLMGEKIKSIRESGSTFKVDNLNVFPNGLYILMIRKNNQIVFVEKILLAN